MLRRSTPRIQLPTPPTTRPRRTTRWPTDNPPPFDFAAQSSEHSLSTYTLTNAVTPVTRSLGIVSARWTSEATGHRSFQPPPQQQHQFARAHALVPTQRGHALLLNYPAPRSPLRRRSPRLRQRGPQTPPPPYSRDPLVIEPAAVYPTPRLTVQPVIQPNLNEQHVDILEDVYSLSPCHIPSPVESSAPSSASSSGSSVFPEPLDNSFSSEHSDYVLPRTKEETMLATRLQLLVNLPQDPLSREPMLPSFLNLEQGAQVEGRRNRRDSNPYCSRWSNTAVYDPDAINPPLTRQRVRWLRALNNSRPDVVPCPPQERRYRK